MTATALDTAWRQQAVWSATASALKRDIARARSLALGLVVLAAIAELAAAQLLSEGSQWSTAGRVSAGVGAAMLAIATVLRSRNLGREHVRDWVRARSASEGLKAAVYLYLTKSDAYAGPNPTGALRATVQRITSQIADLELYAAGVRVPDRQPPGPLDLPGYVKSRVESQINDYYLPRAAELARQFARIRRIELVLTAGAAGMGAFAAVAENAAFAAWVTALTTLAGAVAAHIEAARYEHLVVTYRGTAQRLQALRDQWRDELEGREVTPGEAGAFVKSCEDAISVENEAWLAGWTRDKTASTSRAASPEQSAPANG